jgi:hypothetical protein
MLLKMNERKVMAICFLALAAIFLWISIAAQGSIIRGYTQATDAGLLYLMKNKSMLESQICNSGAGQFAAIAMAALGLFMLATSRRK